ncbi:MAG: FAD-dependent oxidoreductase [Anaerolineae bacterium]|nr:FAD-dependent oxidoreductase [Anaerolineae bacterium]
MTAVKVEASQCTGCSYCTIACPAEAISLKIETSTYPIIDNNRCTQCGECLYICPNNVFSAPSIESPPLPLEKRYDVIVIGAGIGGLMTAAGLAKAGKNVLVLEQMSFVGGKFTHLTHKGYAITTAAWTCPGPNSRIGKLTRKLGADIQWRVAKDASEFGKHKVYMKDGRRFDSLDEAQETIVGGKKGMAVVYDWISDMYNPGVAYPDDMTARQYIRRFFPNNPQYEKYVETIITYCLASQTVDTFSAMETKRAIVDSIEAMATWGTAVGGTAAIVAGLEKVLQQYGGHIATRTRVDKINVQNGKASGVTLKDGRIIEADTVVHNAGLNRLMRLVGEENLPSNYTARLRSAIPANVAALILGTRLPLLGEGYSLLHLMGWERTVNCYAPTFFDPKLAPEGRHALDVFWVMEEPVDKRRELEIVLAELREVFPDFDDVVELQVPMFYTGLWTAEMAHRIHQSGAQRIDPHLPIENLYMVGYDCIGYGMAGDIIPHGVERALYLILGDPAYAPQDEKASTRLNRWVKSKAFKLMALQKRL